MGWPGVPQGYLCYSLPRCTIVVMTELKWAKLGVVKGMLGVLGGPRRLCGGFMMLMLTVASRWLDIRIICNWMEAKASKKLGKNGMKSSSIIILNYEL